MDVERKKYYTVSEAAKIKSVFEDEIFLAIRQGKIQTKVVGLRTMIPAESLFSKASYDLDQEEKYLEQIDEFKKILEKAPRYGTCGLVVTFHEGKITKKNRIFEETRLEGIDYD